MSFHTNTAICWACGAFSQALQHFDISSLLYLVLLTFEYWTQPSIRTSMVSVKRNQQIPHFTFSIFIFAFFLLSCLALNLCSFEIQFRFAFKCFFAHTQSLQCSSYLHHFTFASHLKKPLCCMSMYMCHRALEFFCFNCNLPISLINFYLFILQYCSS